MRYAFVVLLVLGGCASHEYSEVPEPAGEWVAANPPEVTQSPSPAPRPVAWHRRWVRK